MRMCRLYVASSAKMRMSDGSTGLAAANMASGEMSAPVWALIRGASQRKKGSERPMKFSQKRDCDSCRP